MASKQVRDMETVMVMVTDMVTATAMDTVIMKKIIRKNRGTNPYLILQKGSESAVKLKNEA
jgi:hypothetical protein